MNNKKGKMHPGVIREFHLFLCIAILVSTLNLAVFAEENEGSDIILQEENIELLETEVRTDDSNMYLLEPIILEEDTSKRGEFEKHFLCDDGSYMAISYPRAVHMEQGGKWVNIDLPLEQKNDRIVSNTKGSEISLARDTTQGREGSLVSMSSDGYNINWSVVFNGKRQVRRT